MCYSSSNIIRLYKYKKYSVWLYIKYFLFDVWSIHQKSMITKVIIFIIIYILCMSLLVIIFKNDIIFIY